MITIPGRNRLIVLASRPSGLPRPENFALVEEPIPIPAAGQALVRNLLMSVDPAMRPRMDDVPSYVAPFRIGEPLDGQAIGEVVRSENSALPVGTIVQHRLGWRDYAVIEQGTILDLSLAAPSAYLGVLGGKGLTAYVGIVEIANVQPGDRVYISGASGAVGSIAGQIAKMRGAMVIGSTSTPANVEFLRDELGFDRAFLAREETLNATLREVAPDGIDVYFDNVGGATLEAALDVIVKFGRIVACGMISGYNTELSAPRNLFEIVRKRLSLKGFILSDHAASMPAFLELVAPALHDGRIVAPESFFDGLERAPEALIALFDGTPKRGKLSVRLGEHSVRS
jgi:hypothetical protein